tara:strand:- start:859 stop:2019 length:1161 start_codon:yes stop_codon:yes gene_type:complete
MADTTDNDNAENIVNEVEHAMESVIGAFNPINNKLNWLLIALPLAIFFNIQGNLTMAFLFSMVAIMPLAFLMGKGTEEIALRTGEAIGGFLNATFGNAAELIIVGLAIYAASKDPEIVDTMVTVTQASLIGSILGNMLLVLGLAMLWGGLRHKEQSFNSDAIQMNGTLLLLAIVAFITPSAIHHSGGTISDVENISHYAAIVLLVIYGLALLFQLKTHTHVFATEPGHGHHEDPLMTNKDAWILLILATILVAWMAHILVHSLEAAVVEWGMPELFIGVILLPFFGNAAEHFTAVIVAGKDKMDLSIAIAVGSSVQIALFAAPAMILFAWALGVPLTLEFGMLETAATFVSVLVVNSILADGKSNWLEGAMLLGSYVILALAFLQL